MKIAIDISPTQSAHNVRGTGSYTRMLVSALQKYESRHSYHLFTRGQNVPIDTDIIHYPYFDPFFLTLPIRKIKPTVVTVHDLIPIAYPDHFKKGFRGNIKWQIQRLALSGVNQVITDSKASKSDIVKFTTVPDERIHVIYLAPDNIFCPIKEAKLRLAVAAKYRLPDRFFLYVGDINWNKNIVGLLRAFSEYILLSKDKTISLFLIGKAFLDNTLAEAIEINQIIAKLHLDNRVVKLGFVPDRDLAVIYNLASVYIQPSMAEGFGLPVLEAMASGCPVVSSQATSLKEIAGPSIQVDFNDSLGTAIALNKALDLNLKEWRQTAFDWVKQFSWKHVAKQTAAIYAKISER